MSVEVVREGEKVKLLDLGEVTGFLLAAHFNITRPERLVLPRF
jgi:hypothetical protein